MTRGEQLQQKLIKAHENCQAGHISQKAYAQIERSLIRQIKQYACAMKRGGSFG